ncbi:MAG TPA: hypothetical protein VIE65_18825 [Methylobacter sp.]
MTAAQRKQSNIAALVYEEMCAMADDNGLVAISIKSLAKKLCLNEIPVGIAFHDLIKSEQIAVARLSYVERKEGQRARVMPKTYRVISPEEALARQAPNVVRFAPIKQTRDRGHLGVSPGSAEFADAAVLKLKGG